MITEIKFLEAAVRDLEDHIKAIQRRIRQLEKLEVTEAEI